MRLGPPRTFAKTGARMRAPLPFHSIHTRPSPPPPHPLRRLCGLQTRGPLRPPAFHPGPRSTHGPPASAWQPGGGGDPAPRRDPAGACPPPSETNSVRVPRGLPSPRVGPGSRCRRRARAAQVKEEKKGGKNRKRRPVPQRSAAGLGSAGRLTLEPAIQRRRRPSSHDKGPEAEEGVELQEGGDGPGAEEQTAVAIASVQQAAFSDHNIQYQFRTENNGGQAVIQNPFSNGGSPAAEAVSGEARFAYFPASSVGDTTAVSVQTTDQSLQAGGQFYVMMTPQDVLQTGTQRTIAPRTHPYSPKIDGTRTPRDERRRAQHNEVERRRRDKINNWIVQLSKIIPDCNTDNSKTGASKGGILSKACDYIRELRQTNQRMQETFKEAERLQMDNELLRQQIEELKNENAVLRAQLQQHNLEMVGESNRQ
ncbi:upstream stimulatory factor 2 isoform X2 [Pipistrellus kuhlii]|uniref:upstream stimulatory factor 2 isoform X2 n=1 Tax=Pipistrellus kuhlii TaxID=59472 RepID=UPI00174F1775|nr:upstream stimulatory factor 2 isoform X2 [Pipistrellus kuhlii]